MTSAFLGENWEDVKEKKVVDSIILFFTTVQLGFEPQPSAPAHIYIEDL